MDDSDVALSWFRKRAGGIYLDALLIYERLAKQVGWKTDAFPLEQIDMMRLERDSGQ